MDGTLINSEPYWKKAEREVFGAMGIEVTDDQSSITSRMTTKEVTEYWYRFKPWDDIGLEDVQQQVINRVGELIDLHGEQMKGVENVLTYFKNSGYKIGLATNSPDILISKVLKKLNIEQYFDTVISADLVAEGKPSPDIYFMAASCLLTDPVQCLVFEDSKSGVMAALKAGMAVIAIPDPDHYDDVGFTIADFKIRSLVDFNENHIHILNNEIESRKKRML